MAAQKVVQDQGRVAQGVGIEDQEAIFWGEDFGYLAQELVDLLFEFPFLALGAVAPGRRIEHDALVDVSSLGFPFYKLKGVLDQPANVVELAELHVGVGPVDHLFDGVAMDHVCSSGPCGEARPTCIGKEVEHFGGGQSLAVLVDVGPIDGLFGEDADVFEAGEGEPELDVHAGTMVGHLPLVWHLG